MRILITGLSGMLGKALIFENRSKYSIWGTYLNTKLNLKDSNLLRIDIRDKSTLLEEVLKIYPEVIIHTAALTDVDFCEMERDLAYEVNVFGTENVLEAARILNSKFVYISTDFVFDGKNGHYKEEDIPNPINLYGITKLKGEESSLRYGNALVIRTSIFGLNPLGDKPGIDRIIERVKNGDLIYAPVDSFYSPVSVDSLARIIYFLIEKDALGVYHVGSNEKISRFEFYNLLFDVFSLPHNQLLKASFEEYLRGKYAPRPRDVSLTSSKVYKDFHINLPYVKRDLEEIFRIKEEYISFFVGII